MDTHNSPVSVIIDKAFRKLKPMNIIQLSLSYIMQHRQNMVSAQLHEPRIFYPSGYWPETVNKAHISAHFR